MDSVLRKKCLKVENIDETLVTLADDMVETMYAASGLGLAANQVGVSSDFFVIDVGTEKEKRDPVIIINPVITASEDEILAEEGCLSIPEVFAEVNVLNASKSKVMTLKDMNYVTRQRVFLPEPFSMKWII